MSTGLEAFAAKKDEKPKIRERSRAKHERVAVTIRFDRPEWARLHHLAISEGTSLQGLVEDGLNRLLASKGLPALERQG